MNLLLLDQFSDLGGAQQVLLEFLPAIRKKGWRALAGLPGNGKLCDAVRGSGLAVERIDCGPVFRTPRLAAQIAHLARVSPADVVYLNGPRLLPAAALAGLNCPVLFHSHNRVRSAAARTAAGLALRSMNTRVIANCNFVAAQWRPFVAAGQISVVWNGVAGPLATREQGSIGPPRIGCIGRISPEKGQREFVAAAELIHASLPECRFAICGDALFANSKAERYAAQVRKAAARLPIEFCGWRTDVYAALAQFDLLLVPSVGPEATTRVILEAFAAGVPVIAFDTGGISEVVEHGVTGVLSRTVGEMAREAVALLTGNPERRRSMASAARLEWQRRFTISKFQDAMLQALEDAGAQSRQGAFQPGMVDSHQENPHEVPSRCDPVTDPSPACRQQRFR